MWKSLFSIAYCNSFFQGRIMPSKPVFLTCHDLGCNRELLFNNYFVYSERTIFTKTPDYQLNIIS